MALKISKKGLGYIAVVLTLLLIILSQYLQNANQRWELITYKSIPHISLSNVQFEEGGRFYAYIRGFVVFNNASDQPKQLQQYYIIEPTVMGDTYTLKEIIALYPLPPREMDTVFLSVAQNTDRMLVLVDEMGNTFQINKLTKEVTMLDATGDSTRLITSDMDYQEFMREFLTR